MIMRAIPLLIAFACFYGASVAQAQTQNPKALETTEQVSEKDGLKVSISATYIQNDVRAIDLQQSNTHINVLLQNTSSKPINIYQVWNSWGYDNLRLKITKVDGKVLNTPLIVSKGPMDWSENFPSTDTIGPGEVIVREARLHIPTQIRNPASPSTDSDLIEQGPSYWHFPLPDMVSRRQVTMSAVFMNNEATGRRGEKVWTGRIVSLPTNYQVFWGADPR